MDNRSNKSTVLVVDDRADIRISARFALEDNGYQVSESDHPNDAKKVIAEQQVDLILLDMNYSRDTTSGEEGLEFLRWYQRQESSVPVVVMTAWAQVGLAVEAMRLGACDFLEKPWKTQRFLQVIQQQLTFDGLRQQNKKLKQQLQDNPPGQYQWQSGCMQTLQHELEQVAQADVSVFLSGENGTGKSEMARIIHNQSARHDEGFVAVNMGAISESLFESEMFGHLKGAFTDAKSSRIGRFELAHKGTLFLDEIANIPLSQQAKLLKVLETGEYEPLGSSRSQHADVRIVSATNSDMNEMIAQQAFREDLFYRLNTLHFVVPPLRQRNEDIIPLARHFISVFVQKYQKAPVTLSNQMESDLCAYHWPGNIRELSHTIERLVLLSRDGQFSGDLNLQATERADTLPMMTLQEAEITLIKQALAATDNHVPKAASLLGITKSSLYRRLEKYGELQG